MAFVTSKFAAGFAQTVLDNIQTVLERDCNTALAAIDANLTTFADYKTPLPLLLNFPALYLEPGHTEIQQSDDDSHLMQEHELLIGFSLVDADADALKAKLVKYVRAIDQVLRTMSDDDLTGGITSSVGKAVWEVTEHTYGPLRGKDTIYRRDAQLVLKIQIMER
jgi:hypothetical protein